MIIVARCSAGPPAVSSDIVKCCRCGAECWLSKYSGPSTIALAKATGDDRFVCLVCLDEIVTRSLCPGIPPRGRM